MQLALSCAGRQAICFVVKVGKRITSTYFFFKSKLRIKQKCIECGCCVYKL